MKDFASVLQQSQQKPIHPHHPRPPTLEIRPKTWLEQTKDQLVKISGPFLMVAFTGPFNNASILLQVSERPVSDTFARKVETAGEGGRLVKTGIFGDNKIYRPFQFRGYNEVFSQMGKQGIRGLYKGNLVGIVLGLINSKIRTRLYDEGNKVANFSQQWKSNILTILTCTIADLVTQPLLFCQTRLTFQNSLTNFRTYSGAADILRSTSPKQWMCGSSILLLKNILFSYSWLTWFQNAPLQSFLLSSLLSHVVTYPFLTVLRQLQTNAPGTPMMNQRTQKVRQTVARIWRDQGARGFYRGFGGYAVVHVFLGIIMVEMNLRSGYFREMMQ